MIPVHPFQRHFCVIFLSIALVTTLIALKNRDQHRSSDTILTNYTNYFVDFTKTNDSIFTKNYFEYERGFLSGAINVLNNNKKNVLYILGLFELTTKWGRRFEGESEMLAAKLAVDNVNSLNVLPRFILKLLVNDTQCDPGVGIDRLFHALYSKNNIVMLLGAGCSNVSERLAYVVPYWNVIQVSFGSTSPSLSDRSKFPLFFRTVAPDSSHNNAKIHFVKAFGWRVVATFSQSENEFLLPINHLVTELENAQVTCISTVTFSMDNFKEQLKVLKDLDLRIIFASFSNLIAPKIFCAVYEMGMYGEYVWILQNREQLWWNSTNECSIYDMQKAVENIIIISDYNSISKNERSISGMNDDDFETALNMSKSSISKYARQAYDAIWTMALALRDSDIYPYDRNDSFTYYKNYSKNDMVHRWVERLGELRFIGLSGPLKFQGADRVGNSLVQQIQNGVKVDIAVFDSVNKLLDFRCRTCRNIRWKNGQVPVAQRILKVSLVTVPPILLYCILSISFLGICASFLLLYFNLHYRQLKFVKLSSPKLNNVAIIGCIFVYSSVILLEFHNISLYSEVYFNQICSVRIYLLSAGFSLAFGSMFAKTYRVHRLFTYLGAGLVKDKLLKDKQLIGLISIPLIIDGLILALWVAIDPMQRQLYNLTLEVSIIDPGVVYQPQVEVCSSQNTTGWYVALFGYKSIILIMGVFMAWKTRHVNIEALNDSQYIGICVYSAVFSTAIVILSSFVNNYAILAYLAKTTCILMSTTITLVLLFFPKLRTVFGKVNSEDPVMQSMGLKVESNTRRFILDDPKEQILRLEIQNKVYKRQLVALDKDILRLEQLLSQYSSCSTETKDSITAATTIQCHYLNVPISVVGRASWPSAHCELKHSGKEFLSENKLAINHSIDKNKLFEKLRKFLSTFNSLHISHQQQGANLDYGQLKVPKHDRLQPTSSPEIYRKSVLFNTLTKAKSEDCLKQNESI